MEVVASSPSPASLLLPALAAAVSPSPVSPPTADALLLSCLTPRPPPHSSLGLPRIPDEKSEREEEGREEGKKRG
uniref:Uncharacterized protein n=1 Tax=Oryza meridionalis TaxID=40149 RepID=A0A0E0F210_9ORYZ